MSQVEKGPLFTLDLYGLAYLRVVEANPTSGSEIRTQQVRPVGPSRFTVEETYAQTRLPLDEASTIAPEAYFSQEFYDVEQVQVFSKSWTCVGYTQQLQRPGGV